MKLNKNTLSEQIYEILRNDIISQRIPSGTKLTLKLLKERFEVSSTPIREALTRLSEEQLVAYYSNIGINVVELNNTDLREIYELMGDLDSLAVRYAAAQPEQDELVGKLDSNISEAEILLAEMPDNLQPDSPVISRYIELSDRFHLIFYNYCGNSRLVRAAERMRSQMSIAAYEYEKNSANLRDIHAEHLKIYQEYKSGDTTKAALLMKNHLMKSLELALALRH